MKSFLLKVLVAVFLFDLFLLAWRIAGSSSSLRVLSHITSATLNPIHTFTPTPISTPTQTLTPTPTPLPTLTPTPSPGQKPSGSETVPQPKFSQEEIHGFIENFAAQYGVDPNVLRHIAVCESGLRANAVNGPYVGLFQFGSSSWINNRRLMGEDLNLDLRFNAEESVKTAAFIASRGIKNIWPNCYP